MKSVQTKRKEADERNEFYNSLSVKQKIELLDKKFGPGKGAMKERNKLQKKLQA